MSSLIEQTPDASTLVPNNPTLKRKASSDIEENKDKIPKIKDNKLECNICVQQFDAKFKYICYNCGNIICLECKKKVSLYSGKTVRCPHCKCNNNTELSIPNHRKNIELLVKISRENKNYNYIYEEIIKINRILEYEVTQGSIDCNKFILEISKLFICYEYYELAYNWYNFLVDLSGNINAIIKLGKMYEKGYHVKQNYEEAIRLYKDVINKGYIEGNFFLAHLYENGFGVEKDLKEANRLNQLIARQYIINKLA